MACRAAATVGRAGVRTGEGEVVKPACRADRRRGFTVARISYAMDCKIRATSGARPPAGPSTHVIPSRSTAPTGGSGRRSRSIPPELSQRDRGTSRIWRSTSSSASPAGGDTYLIPSHSTAPTGGSGRRSRSIPPESSISGWPNTHVIPSRSTAPPGGSGREAEHSAGVIYLMNKISEYFGSGQRSSATRSSRASAISRTSCILASCLSRAYSASSRPSMPSG